MVKARAGSVVEIYSKRVFALSAVRLGNPITAVVLSDRLLLSGRKDGNGTEESRFFVAVVVSWLGLFVRESLASLGRRRCDLCSCDLGTVWPFRLRKFRGSSAIIGTLRCRMAVPQHTPVLFGCYDSTVIQLYRLVQKFPVSDCTVVFVLYLAGGDRVWPVAVAGICWLLCGTVSYCRV